MNKTEEKKEIKQEFITYLRDFNQNRLLNEQIVIQTYDQWLNEKEKLNSVSLKIFLMNK